jgi:drug/metabolite transporter (DMT)-like permease
LIGFCGVILMLWPHLSANALTLAGGTERAQGAFFSLIGACCAAFAMIEVRKLTATESTAAIVTYFSLMTTVLGTFTLIGGALDPRWAWMTPDAKHALYLVMVGIMGGIGQIFLTESYRRAPASLVAPFDYSSMIFAIAIGYFLFGTLPDSLVLIGAVIVSGAGIFVIWRERELGIDRAKQGAASSSRAL